MGLPDGLDGILRNEPVARDDGETFRLRLRDKKPVKWIAMDVGQFLDAINVPEYGVRVEKIPHHIYFAKSSIGASKSDVIPTLPLSAPYIDTL